MIEWWKDKESLTYKLFRSYPDKMTSGTETRLTIKLTTGFELWGGYETWDSGFEAEDEKGNKFTSKTLEGLVEKIFKVQAESEKK